MRRLVFTTAFWVFGAGVAAAADLAVIVTNQDYLTVRDADTGADIGRLTDALDAMLEHATPVLRRSLAAPPDPAAEPSP